MNIIDLQNENRKVSPEELKGIHTVVALGNFDGVHVGHRVILQRTVQIAQENQNTVPVVFSFLNHPQKNNGSVFHSIFSEMEKRRRLASTGIRFLFEYDFSVLKDMTPQTFVKNILIDDMHCYFAVCGENFTFGAKAAGTPILLKQLMEKYLRQVFICQSLYLNHQIVSSTRIRNLLKQGKIPETNILLGAPYSFTESVIYGNHIGSSSLYPTVNLPFSKELVSPMFGVYASKVTLDGKTFLGVTNIGTRPTIAEKEKTINVETYLLNYSGDLYGKMITLTFFEFLRQEEFFSDLPSLKAQITKDIAQSMRCLSRLKGTKTTDE